jgi:hypothetical protein
MPDFHAQILTIEVRLSGWRGTSRKWIRAIELPKSATLYALHDAIQNAIDFDDDHMYEFYVGKRWNKRERDIGESASPMDPGSYDKILLSDVFPLGKALKLYYWFDFGDDWMFEITCRPEMTEANKKIKYPNVVEKSGVNGNVKLTHPCN